MASVRQNKKVEKELEELNLAPLDTTGFVRESSSTITPMPPPTYKAEEGEEELEILGLEEEEVERVEAEQAVEEETVFHPQDITWDLSSHTGERGRNCQEDQRR